MAERVIWSEEVMIMVLIFLPPVASRSFPFFWVSSLNPAKGGVVEELKERTETIFFTETKESYPIETKKC
jgi:hypothetical protein